MSWCCHNCSCTRWLVSPWSSFHRRWCSSRMLWLMVACSVEFDSTCSARSSCLSADSEIIVLIGPRRDSTAPEISVNCAPPSPVIALAIPETNPPIAPTKLSKASWNGDLAWFISMDRTEDSERSWPNPDPSLCTCS